MSISELFWNFLHFIHNKRIIIGGGGGFFVHPLYVQVGAHERIIYSEGEKSA